MVCDLKTVAGRDWYAWAPTSWWPTRTTTAAGPTPGYAVSAWTACLAVLFLKRVNVAKDLTAQLKMIAPIKDLLPINSSTSRRETRLRRATS